MKSKSSKKFRTERDSMGEMQIPSEMLYGASTQRAVLNFPISGRTFSRAFIHALGQTKLSAAKANLKLKRLDGRRAAAIVSAAGQVRDGHFDEHFVLDVFQTGSGTSTNMNANEVIANLANRKLGIAGAAPGRVHPNDHVNKGQSSNDVIPTVIHVAAALEMRGALIPALHKLERALGQKARRFASIHKIGRTHLQDATPVTLGLEFGGYAEQARKSIQRLEKAMASLRELPLGGTAVGTGINTHPRFARLAIADLNRACGEKFFEAKNHFEAQSAKDACVEASGQLKAVAVALMKIANDIRWLGSGPRAGFAEIKLPAVQPGSSIMPGKINPVMSEALLQAAAEVIGNDTAITIAGQYGNFELNVMMPLIAYNLLESVRLLANAVNVFTDRCVAGIEADARVCEAQIEKSLMLCTALVPALGYDKSAELAKEAYKAGKTIRQIVLEKKLIPEKELTRLLNVKNLSAGE